MDIKLFLKKVASEKRKKKAYCLYLNKDLVNQFRELIEKEGNGWNLSSCVEAILREMIENSNDKED